MMADQHGGGATLPGAAAGLPKDYWLSHVPCGTQDYALSKPLRALIFAMASVGGAEGRSVMQYLKLRGVKFTRSKDKWNEILRDSEVISKLSERMKNAVQTIGNGRKGRTLSTDMEEIMTGLGIPLDGKDFCLGKDEIPEPVKLPFAIMLYEEWEKTQSQNTQQAPILLPDRDMFVMGEGGPKHIQIKFPKDSAMKEQLESFRDAIQAVVDDAITGGDTNDKNMPKHMERMNNGVMITPHEGGTLVKNSFWSKYESQWERIRPDSDPFLPPELNEFITDEVSKCSGCKMICEQGYILDSCPRDVDRGLSSPQQHSPGILDKIRPGKYQPAHIDADSSNDKNAEDVFAGCMYFQDTLSTTTYDMRDLPSTFGNDMTWEKLHNDVWTDSPPGLKEHLECISEVEKKSSNDNPLAWLQSVGRLAYSNPTQRLKAKEVGAFDIAYFNADTVHCGPVPPSGRRTSYFFLLRKEDTTKVKEHQEKKEENKRTKKKTTKEKVQTTKERLLIAILEIVVSSKDSELEWELYLLDKFLCAIAESAVYGASDKNIDWKGGFLEGLKKFALDYANLANEVFMSLKSTDRSEAKRISSKMRETSRNAAKYVEAHHIINAAKASVDISGAKTSQQSRKSKSGSKKRKATPM